MCDTLGLHGKLIKVLVTDERVRFQTSTGIFTFEAEGDCCAHAYLHQPQEAQEDLNRLIGQDITSNSFFAGTKIRSEYDHRDVKFYTIQGETDFAVLTLYTDHNGYYGGALVSAEYPDPRFEELWSALP